MKIYKDHIVESCKNNFNISFFKWNSLYDDENSLRFKFYKYIKSRRDLKSYPKPFIQHITDQSYAHLYNNNASFNYLTVHDINPIILYKEKLGTKKIPPLLFKYTSLFYKKFNKIITPSFATKNLLIEHLNIEDRKIFVVKNAIDLNPSNQKRVSGLNILMIGDTFTKNIPKSIRAIRKFIALKKIEATLHWVVSSSKTKVFLDNLIQNDKNLKVKIYTNLSSQKMLDLYAMNSVLLFPSIVEGFGYPIIEAMRHKMPVITSNKGATNEIAGNFCIKVDPFSIDDITRGLISFYDEDNTQLKERIELAYSYSYEFNLKKFKQEILEVYSSNNI
jgi:glycosyltransferase involved in cell wall biosynthesis